MSDPAHEMNFEGEEQENFERHHADERDHFFKVMMHRVGAGPNPGMYRGPGRGPKPEPTEDLTEALAQEYLRERGPAPELAPAPPLPPQEAVQQPTPQKAKRPAQKLPSGTTPAALGAAAAQPPKPEGEF